MKVKTSELIDQALVWAVAILEFPKGSYGGEADHYSGNNNERWIRVPDTKNRTYVLAKYPTDWAQGGPIIEREDIAIGHGNSREHPDNRYSASKLGVHPWAVTAEGPTKLVAAMRCYVASKLGDEVDVPDVFVGAKP